MDTVREAEYPVRKLQYIYIYIYIVTCIVYSAIGRCPPPPTMPSAAYAVLLRIRVEAPKYTTSVSYLPTSRRVPFFSALRDLSFQLATVTGLREESLRRIAE